jgi:hypothetical protein
MLKFRRTHTLSKFIIPVFYILAVALMVFNSWDKEITSHRDGGPLYRDLMEGPAYIRRGFNPDELKPSSLSRITESEEWVRFESSPYQVMESPLPDLPKRPFLSPWGRDIEEFTIIIPIEMDNEAITYLNDHPMVIPGIYFSIIGDNWQIFYNGTLMRSEIHLDENGKMLEQRLWRDVYFPIDRSLVVSGTNILALRIVGDPTYAGTGLYYDSPHYMYDYRIIERRQHNYLLFILFGVFGFSGVYTLLLFLSLRDRRQIFYLFFSIFSLLLC